MGDLIVMKRPQDVSRVAAPSGASAEILFFTGVRYYRMPDDFVAPSDVARRRSEKTKQVRRIKARAAAATISA